MMRKWLTVAQFLAEHPGELSRNTAYERIKDGTLPSIKLGRKILVPADAFERLLSPFPTDPEVSPVDD